MVAERLRAQRGDPRRRGTILLPALIFAVILAGAAVAYSTTVGSAARHRGQDLRRIHAELAAEAGLAAALVELRAGRTAELGSEEEPVDFGGLDYYTEWRDVGGGRFSLVAVGENGNETHALEALVESGASQSAAKAVFGLESVHLASNVSIDSYDPDLGTYASQAVRRAGKTVANANGHIATNGDLEIRSNTTVYGDARWGPDGDDSYVSSGIVAGEASALESDLELDIPEPPSGASTGSLTIGARDSDTIGPGTVILDDVVIEGRGTLTIVGPADVVVDSFELETRGTFEVDATAGAVQLFCYGDFLLQSNATVSVTADDATAVTAILLAEQPDPDDRDQPFAFDSNGTWIGTILAPEALVDISSNFEIFGAVLARWVELSANTQLHYDERLDDSGTITQSAGWVVLGTRALSGSQLDEVQAVGGQY